MKKLIINKNSKNPASWSYTDGKVHFALPINHLLNSLIMFKSLFFQMQNNRYTLTVYLYISLFFVTQSVSAQDKPILMQNIKVDSKYLALENNASPQLKQKIAVLRTQGMAGKWTFQVGVTSVSNRKISEITGAIPPNSTAAPTQTPTGGTGSAPVVASVGNVSSSSFDLRAYNLVTPIRDQGQCGSCWAFCTVASLESAHILRNKLNPNTLDLSEQQILNCSGAGSCGGGKPDNVWNYVKTKSCVTESSYGYLGTDRSCPVLTPTDYKIDNWGWVGANPGTTTVQEIKNALVKYATVSSYVYVNHSFQHYVSGVLNDNSRHPEANDEGWHCVQIIGWNDNLSAWLVKNSWGTAWGEKGFFWINYSVLDIGKWSTWVVANPKRYWSGENLLGTPTNQAQSLATGQNRDGRLELFYIGTDNKLYHNWQVTSSGAWSGENLLGTPTNQAKSLAIGQNSDGRLEVFYIGTNNTLYHNWQVTAGGTWSGENLLGTPTNQAKSLAIGQNSDGRLEVFYIGTDNKLYHNWQVAGGRWSGENLLGTPTNQAKSLAIGRNLDGRLELFYIGTDNKLYHNWQVTGGRWSGENLLGTPTNQAKSLTIGRNTDGRLELFYIGTDNRIYHNWQVTAGGRWSGENLLGTPTNQAKSLATGQNRDGRLELFYIGTNNTLYHNWQVTAGGSWSGEDLLEMPTNQAKSLTIDRNRDGRLELFYIGTDNKLYHNWQQN